MPAMRFPTPRSHPHLIALVLALALTGCPRKSAPMQNPPPTQARPSPAAAAPEVRFRDVGRALGIDFRHAHAGSGNLYFPEIMGAGGLFFDYDGDGDQDIYLVNGAPLPGFQAERPLTPALYRNEGGAAFTDVTRQAGLAMEFYGMGAAAADYDNDGDLDLYATAVLGPSRLFRNDGDGTFTEVTRAAGVDNDQAWGTSVAWLDYDRDGWVDLFVCSYVHYYTLEDDLPCYFKEGVRTYCIPFTYRGDTCRLYRNRGDGRFEDVTRASGIHSDNAKSLGVVVWDYNQDDWPDIFVANDTEPTFLYQNNGDRTFTDVALERGIAFGETGAAKAGMGVDLADDLNNGTVTYAGSAFSGETFTLARFQGDLFFQDEAVRAGIGEPTLLPLGFGTCFLDFDNDGWQDLLFVNGHVYDNVELLQDNVAFKQKTLLFWNRRDGTYQEVGPRALGPLFTMDSAAAGETGRLLGRLRQEFAKRRLSLSEGAAVQVEEEGARWRIEDGEAAYLVRREEDGLQVFAVGAPFRERIVGRGSAWGDFDDDGRLDLLITENNGPARLWRNETPAARKHRWLKLVLTGTASNRSGIGARIVVQAGGITQRQQVKAGHSYLTQSDLRPHFGLGSATVVEAMEIHWPSGLVDRWERVGANQILHVTEGETQS